MQITNYAIIINAIDVYDDEVLIAARDFARLLLTGDEIDTSALHAALEADKEAISDWSRPCWCHTDILEAIESYDEEMHHEAVHYLVLAMLTRSRNWESAFV